MFALLRGLFKGLPWRAWAFVCRDAGRWKFALGQV